MAVAAVVAPAVGELTGWQGMRVIEQEGDPAILRGEDVDGDGREELIVVNTRYSKIEFYRWLSEGERKAPEPAGEDQPNELPMAVNFKRSELQLEQLPQDVAIKDVDGNGQAELIVLVSSPNRILVYGRSSDGSWQERQRFELLPGDAAPRHGPLIVRCLGQHRYEALIGCNSGVQTLVLEPGSRADWLTPRQKKGREAWWLVDLDGDGDADLVEQSRDTDQAMRWYACSSSGHLMPAQVLLDRAVKGAAVLEPPGSAAQLLVLDGAVQGLARRYALGDGRLSGVGGRRPLVLAGGTKAIWCGMRLGETTALVAADPERPRLLAFPIGDEGWQEQQSYPVIGDVQAIAAPVAEPGLLLLWAKGAAGLHASRWLDDRLSYPTPWPHAATEDRRILALASAGSVTWWVQVVDDDLHHYHWRPEQTEPERTVFEGVGANADQVMWLGGRRLLIKETHARTAKLAVVHGETTEISEPAHLKKVPMTELKLVSVNGTFRVARLTDGVLQWLGDDLRPVDQVMLPQGRRLTDYAAMDREVGWAVEEDGKSLHRIEASGADLARVTRSVPCEGGQALVRDAVLGLVLIGPDRITRLTEGKPQELKLVDIIDDRIGRAHGVKETKIDRLETTDVDGDGTADLLLLDDHHHRITVLRRVDDVLCVEISWPVFEDKKYPYTADDADQLAREPRAVVGADLDGDRQQDLAMICHDRLLLYLANDPQ